MREPSFTAGRKPPEVAVPFEGSRPALDRRRARVFALGMILLLAGLIVLYTSASWIYVGPLEQLCTCTAGNGCTCQPTYYQISFPIFSAAQLAALLLASLYPVVAVTNPRWPLRAFGILTVFLVTGATLWHVYAPPTHAFSSLGTFGHPSVSAVGFFASLVVAAGGFAVAAVLLDGPTYRRKPTLRRGSPRSPGPWD